MIILNVFCTRKVAFLQENDGGIVLFIRALDGQRARALFLNLFFLSPVFDIKLPFLCGIISQSVEGAILWSRPFT